MKYSTWLRWAGCLTAIGIALSASRSSLALDQAAADQQASPAKDAANAQDPALPKQAAEPKDAKQAKGVEKAQGRVIVPKYRLGAALGPVPTALNDQLNLKGVGLLISAIAPGGPADKAGIKRDDILLAIGDKPIKKYGDLVELSNNSGGMMSVKLLRGGETITATVTLDKHRKNDEKVFVPSNPR